MRIETAVYSCRGGRDYNEDSVECLVRENVCVAVVADGLGGHGGGQVASSAAARLIAEAFMEDPQTAPEHIRRLFEQANDEVLKKQTPAIRMKSTGVCLFVMEDTAVWGHVGDSRLYHFANGKLVYQTLDHSVSQMAVFSGEIVPEEIRSHADRNKVLRAFGGGETIKADIASEIKLEPGPHAFLLCTDGFWEYVLEPEMESDLNGSESPRDWIQAMLQRLARRVPDNNDNYSAAAVLIDMEGGANEEG